MRAVWYNRQGRGAMPVDSLSAIPPTATHRHETPGRMLSVADRFPLYETATAHLSVERGDKIVTVVLNSTC